MADLADDLRVAARALRGTSWPKDMAEWMERRAERLAQVAEWIDVAAAVRQRTLNGWYPILHELIEPPQWSNGEGDHEVMSLDEVAWFAPDLPDRLPDSIRKQCELVPSDEGGDDER